MLAIKSWGTENRRGPLGVKVASFPGPRAAFDCKRRKTGWGLGTRLVKRLVFLYSQILQFSVFTAETIDDQLSKILIIIIDIH